MAILYVQPTYYISDDAVDNAFYCHDYMISKNATVSDICVDSGLFIIGETPECGFGTLQRKKKTPITKFIGQNERTPPRKLVAISFPEDFRRVSAIIDVDIVPETHRRVRLMKNGSEKPLGFYIRDGVSVRVTSHGLEKVCNCHPIKNYVRVKYM